MGFLKNILSSFSGGLSDSFIKTVRANDNGEEWAKKEIQRMFTKEGNALVEKVHRARVIIYKDAALNGDREAIIKYARGLEWSGRKEEALSWFMKLINQGDTDAMVELASDYTEYGGMGENEAEYLKWIKQAAKMNNSYAQYKLSLEYGSKGDWIKENIWAKKSAEGECADGKRQYADCIKHEFTIFSTFIRYPENMPGNLEERRKFLFEKYDIKSLEDVITVMRENYSLAEQLYIDYLQEGTDDVFISEVHRSLARLYLYPPQYTCEPSYYLAAYYFYLDYYYFDFENSLNEMKKIIAEHNLKITKEDLKEWLEIGIFDWAKTRKIDL